MRYLVQFPAGLSLLVGRALSQTCAGYREVYADDSALVFDTSTRFARADEVEVGKNVFVVWASAPRRNLAKTVARLTDAIPAAIRPNRPDRNGFRTMVQIDGALTGLDRGTRTRLESALVARTGQRVQSRGGNTEYWVMGRRDHDELWLLERLPRRTKPSGRAGALSAELAAALVLASDPRASDVFCDPFAGSGTLVLARSRRPARSLVYGDRDLAGQRDGLPAELLADRRVRLVDDDALELPSVPDRSIEAIVTDPPWGEYEPLDRPYDEFVGAMAASFRRVLSASGRLVLLTSRRTADEAATAFDRAGLPVTDQLAVLLNGHPVTVLLGHG